MVIKIN